MKTYELTQEQINQLAEKKHAKELLQQFIPEAFETKLEVGKYYIHKIHNDLINIAEINEKDEIKFYGFDYDETENTSEFIDERNSPLFYGYGKEFKNWRLATEEEVSEALINEAKKRGFNNIGNLKIKNTVGSISNGFVTTTNDFYYYYKGNTLRLDGAVIFNNGVWAEIIEEPKETEEEIKRVLNYLLKNGEKLHNEI